MGGIDFTVALAVAGFLLASWVDSKVGESRPGTPARLTVHVVAGFVILEASVGVLYLVEAGGAPEVWFLAAVLGVFLPALVYMLLTGLWLIRMLVEIRRLARR
jgi:hypothetical protein